MTTATRPATVFARRKWTPSATPLDTPRDQRWLVTVGAPHIGQDGFWYATTVVGTIEQAQKVAGECADGRAVWCRDVLSGEVWHRPAGGLWTQGEGEG